MMKIAIVGPAHPLRGGIAAFSERLALEYFRAGHQVTLFSYCLQYPKLLFPGKTQYTSDPPPEGFIINPVINSINPLSWCNTVKDIKKLNPDMVLVMYWIPFMSPALGTIVKKLKRKLNVPVLAIVHNMIPHENKPFYNMLSRYFVRQVDGFIAMADAVNEDIKRFDNVKPKPKRVSPHPIYDHYGEITPKQVARSLLNIPPDRKTILFFGLVREYKGLDLLIKAMAHEAVRALNVHLMVAGEFYVKKENYTNLIEDLHLQEVIRLDDHFIPNESVAAYFNASDLVALPYRTATQSGVTQIAYHFNKPVLVTNVGGLAEIVPNRKAGFVVEKDPEEIAKAIIAFYRNDMEHELVEGVKAHKKRYEWPIFIKEVQKLYEEVKVNK